MPAPRHTLDQLAVLDAIARAGSFAGAAEATHRVPSAISYAVHTLEEALGVALFDRSGRKAELTPAGRRLLDEGRELLARAAQFERLAASLGEGWEPDLRIVVDGALPMAPITAALGRFVAQRLPTQVHLDVEYQDGVLHRFDADHADLMLALGLEDGGRLKGTPLPPLPMVLVAAATHPLARPGPLHRDALLEHVDLVVKDTSPAYAAAPRQAFLGTQNVLRLSDFHTKRAALRSGVGFGWLPLHLAEADLQSGALVLLDLPEGNRWTYHPQLVTRRDAPQGRAAALYTALLLAETHQKM